MRDFFGFDRYGTDTRKEVLAGTATFLTMAYIVVVNPAILEIAGIPKGPSTTATILAAAFGCAVMGLYARRPFALAPYMGENAFIAVTVVKGMGYSWQSALGAVFVAGALFALLTLLGIRSRLAEAIPASLKFSFAVGIGLFMTFIGLGDMGVAVPGVPGAPVGLGNLSEPTTLLSVAGFLLIALLVVRRVRGAIVLGILATTLASFLLGLAPVPRQWVGLPPDVRPLLFRLDIAGALSPGFFPVILTIFIMAFVDTVGTLIGLSARAGLLDGEGNLPGIEKPMLADALATMAAPLLGTTTTGAFIESAAGIEEGGRTGLTALVTGLLFLLALFFAPFIGAIPRHAYGPVLAVIGIFMVAPIARIDFSDPTELFPAFLTIVLMSFTFNIGVGMTAGLLFWPVLKTLSGRGREVRGGMWVLAGLSVVFYAVYPYR